MCYKKNLVGGLDTYDGEKHPAHKVLVNVDNYKTIESNPTILGMVGILDPPRAAVKGSIQQC